MPLFLSRFFGSAFVLAKVYATLDTLFNRWIAMSTTLAGLLACFCYTCLAGWQWRDWRLASRPQLYVAILITALGLHGFSVYTLIDTAAGFNFAFFHVSSLIFWVICITVALSSIHLPLRGLLPPLFMMTVISVLCSILLESPYTPHTLSYPVALHILLSILAYSILTIAAMQALALALQDHLLKTRQLQKVMAQLPPLQTMESLLFQMVWAGTVLLAFSIASGLLFLHDILAQHLAHKMFFSFAALLVYCALLWGRHARGWRGKQAIRWTVGGFLALMIAYFGTKLVLEVLLHY